MSTNIILETKFVADISGSFYIPSYQRGYRWSETEVVRLLDDIYQNGKKNYCLQPVVVRKKEDQYELIDGQQRLTTLYLIYKLNEYLSYEIDSPTVLRKTREILMNIWVYDNPYSSYLKSEAVQLIEKYPEYAVSINWCMMLAAYPVFLDMCKLIGKMSEFQDEITLAQLKQKLFDEWGERTTLYHSIDKLISTLKEFDVLRCEKPGKYHINRMTVNNEQVSAFMAYAVMNIDDSGYYSFQELNDSVYLFPFEYHVEKETIVSDDRFSISTFGGEISISLT